MKPIEGPITIQPIKKPIIVRPVEPIKVEVESEPIKTESVKTEVTKTTSVEKPTYYSFLKEASSTSHFSTKKEANMSFKVYNR